MKSPGGADRLEPVTNGAVKPVEKKLEPVPQLEGALGPVPEGREPDREFRELVKGTPLDGEPVGKSPDEGGRVPDLEFRELVKGTPLDGEPVGRNPEEGGRVPDLELIEFVKGGLLGYGAGPVLNGMLPVDRLPERELIELVNGVSDDGDAPDASVELAPLVPDENTAEEIGVGPVPDGRGMEPEPNVELAPLVPVENTPDE